MPLFRYTNIMQLTTVPLQPTYATSHIGGWSESFWSSDAPAAIDARWLEQQRKRAGLLPATATIVGYRTQEYLIAGNVLVPGGATSGRQLMPGRNALGTDIPQMALMLQQRAAGAPNTARMTLRGIPDLAVGGGEYNPTGNFTAALSLYKKSMVGQNMGFVGRDLSQALVRVNAIDGAIITVSAIPATGLVVGDFVRLNRVHGNDGKPIKGAFRVVQIAGLQLTVQNLTGALSKPSGSLRRDALQYFPMQSLTEIRVVVKKVGRPFEQYRGRRSKRRA